jgi:myo-inositol-1(or 4)-monophosphatase
VSAASTVTLDRFRATDLRVDTKASTADVVTDADLASEEVVRRIVFRERPNDGFIGEEEAATSGTSRVTWLLDPIDSTANYARGIPIWSISLAVRDDVGVMAGIVAYPPGTEVVSGTRATGVMLDGRPVSRRQPVALEAAMVAIGWGSRSSGRRQEVVAGSLIPRVGKVRSPGSPALGLSWTALGRFDAAYYEMEFGEWDVSAGAFLCECAGLVVRREGPDGADASPRILAAPRDLVDDLSRFVFE